MNRFPKYQMLVGAALVALSGCNLPEHYTYHDMPEANGYDVVLTKQNHYVIEMKVGTFSKSGNGGKNAFSEVIVAQDRSGNGRVDFIKLTEASKELESHANVATLTEILNAAVARSTAKTE